MKATRRALLMSAGAAAVGVAAFRLFAQKPEPRGALGQVRITPPSGPFVANPNWFDFATDSSERLLVLVGSDGSVLRSVDGGQSLERALTDVAEPLFSVALHEAKRSVVAVGGDGCVVQSSDAAHGFVRRASGVQSALRRVIVSRGGTFLAVGDKGALVHSTDGGVSFRAESVATDANLGFIAELPNAAGFVLAGEHGTIVRGEPGKAWERLSLGVDAVITSLMVTPAGHVIVGSEAGIFCSRDARRFELAAGSAELLATSFTSDREAKTLIATTRNGKLARSSDGGKSWSSVVGGANEYLATATFDAKARVFFAVGNAGTLLKSDAAATRFDPVHIDAKQDLEAIHVSKNGRAWIAGRGGVLAARNASGVELQLVSQGISEYLHQVVCDARGERLLAVGSHGLCVRSSDGGCTWSRVELPVPETTTLYALVEHRSSRSLLIGGSGGVLLRSSDAGVSFTPVRATTGSVASFYVHAERVLALVLDEGVLFSDDGGATFQRAKMPEAVSLLSLTSVGENALVGVGMNGAIVRSVDGGSSFQRVDSPTTAELRAIAHNPKSGDCWVIGAHGSVLRSSDGGQRFSLVDTGTEANLLALGFHEASRSLVIAGTAGTLLELSDGAERFRSIDTSTKEKLRLVLTDPRSGDLLIGGSGGSVLRGRTPRSLRALFTHTKAPLASAAYHPTSASWVLVGERVLRLPMNTG